MILKNLLFYRLVIFNSLGFVGLAVAYWMGLLNMLVEHDAVGITYVIGTLLIVGVIGSFIRGWKTSQVMNRLKAMPSLVHPSDVRKMPHKNEYIRDMAGWAVLMGLFGNAIGFAMALADIDTALQAAGVAFGGTAAGILVALWLEVNFSMIRTATALALEEVSE